MSTAGGDAGVTFTVKEMLVDIQQRLTLLDAKLDTKANTVELSKLEGKIETLERREYERAALESDYKIRSRDTFSRREKILASMIALMAVIAQLFYFLHGVSGA